MEEEKEVLETEEVSKNNKEKEVKVEEKKKTKNVCSIVGFILSFIEPIAGFILSIIGLVKVKKYKKGKGLSIAGIVISVLMLAVHIYLLCVLLLVNYLKVTPEVVVDDETEQTEVEEEVKPSEYDKLFDFSKVSESSYKSEKITGFTDKTGTKYYFIYNENYDYDYHTNSNDYLTGLNVVGSYTCKSNSCGVVTVENKLATIYDNSKYFVYDYRNSKTIADLDIPMKKYSNIVPVIKNNEIVGAVLSTEYGKSAYYDIVNKKFLIDYGIFNFINVYEYSGKIGHIFLIKDEDYKKCYVFDINEGKIVKDGIYKMYSNGEYTYYVSPARDEYYDEEIAIGAIYDSNFNKIDEIKDYGTTGVYFSKKGELVYSFNGRYNVIYENKISYRSKKYNDVYDVIKDYVIVNDGNSLNLLDYYGNRVTTFATLSENDYVHSMLSGWYTDNNKNGVYVIVSTSKVSCDEISEDILNDFFNYHIDEDGNANWDVEGEDVDPYQNCVRDRDEYQENGLAYEYYYIPKTKETGKIGTVVGGYAKPVLYLYPEKDNTKIKVQFEHPEYLTTTYPKFDKSWEVTANKNGDLHDSNGKYYYGLYWEESGSSKIDFSEGFYVEADNAIDFLEEKLSIIGLNEREANEFIMYWLPILESNKKSLVYFELTNQRNAYNKLNITPEPDSLLRVAIHVKKVDKKVNIKEQKLATFNRSGFTAVEWGGVQH